MHLPTVKYQFLVVPTPVHRFELIMLKIYTLLFLHGINPTIILQIITYYLVLIFLLNHCNSNDNHAEAISTHKAKMLFSCTSNLVSKIKIKS